MKERHGTAEPQHHQINVAFGLNLPSPPRIVSVDGRISEQERIGSNEIPEESLEMMIAAVGVLGEGDEELRRGRLEAAVVRQNLAAPNAASATRAEPAILGP